MKKVISVVIVITLLFCSLALTSCSNQSPDKNIKTTYKTAEEWKSSFVVEDYGENKELTEVPENRPSAKCTNGTFVGNKVDDVDVFKGIPYAKQPLGELRFKRAEAPDASDKIFDATYFGKSCMQDLNDSELASQYEQGEDCLCLNVWNSTAYKNDKKPVFVYIHGGGWNSGGTADPLYNGFNFAHYNPDVIVVTITYRFNMLGLINLSSFPDGEDYKYSANNALYDQIQALKWLNENISAFGGDEKNITVCGESAGGGSVSLLCTIEEARKYFAKAIPMSGSVNQANAISVTEKLPKMLKEEFKVETVADLQKIPFDDLRKWWSKNFSECYHHTVRDGVSLSKDPFSCWENGDTKDIIVMQGHTANEFRYYQFVFEGVEEFYDAICKSSAEIQYENGSDEYKKAYDEYVKALKDLGYKDDEIAREYMNDRSLAIGNTYQAICHANNGGKGYSYTFEQGYDGKMADYGAAHAIDCYYLFGNFDGDTTLGTNEQLDLSRKFQRMISNFCLTGDPSIEGLTWPQYTNETRQKMMIGSNMRVEDNPEGARVDCAIEMLKTNEDFRYTGSLATVIPVAAERYPDAMQKFLEKKAEASKNE